MREINQVQKRQESNAKNPPANDSKLEADAESAAAEAEPMGSIAAAVPGNDKTANDVTETGQQPGAESAAIREQPKTTAGTEAKLEQEEVEVERKSKQPNDRKNAA